MGNKARQIFRMNPNGFTLIEMMIAIAITGIVLTAIYNVLILHSRSYRTQQGAADAQQRARAALDFMVENIRMAGFNPSASATDATEGGDVGIKQASSTNIRFTTDRDMNETIDTNNRERVTFTWNQTNPDPNQWTLDQITDQNTASSSTQPLTDRVINLNFTYLNADGAAINEDPVTPANLANIRSVIIQITCQGVGERGQLFTRTMSTQVSCRNLSV